MTDSEYGMIHAGYIRIHLDTSCERSVEMLTIYIGKRLGVDRDVGLAEVEIVE